jgi:hypothetical protein
MLNFENKANRYSENNTATEADAALTAIAKSAPSISSSALLVNVIIRHWSAQAGDKQVAEQAEHLHGADKGTVKATKSLLGKMPEIVAIKAFTKMVRDWHNSQSMPWVDKGPRLVTTARFLSGYQTQLTEFKNTFENDLVPAFLEAYAWRRGEYMIKQGSMAKDSDFPPIEEVATKFGFSISEDIIAESGDWRLDINRDALQVMVERNSKLMQERVTAAVHSVWERAHKALTHMSERLDYEDTGETEEYKAASGRSMTRRVGVKKFQDTLVEHVNHIVDIMNTCNITNDPTMQMAQLKLTNAMRGVTPDALRENNTLREDTKKAVDAVIALLPDLNF